MKPKTILQNRVHTLSLTLNDKLASELKPWAFDNIAEHWGHRTKAKTACLSCGHTYQGSQTTHEEKCPACNRKLKVVTTAKKKAKQRLFFYVINTCKEFQLNRIFEMYVYNKAGEEPRIFCWEICQQWIQPVGKDIIVARVFGGMGNFDGFSGDLEIRRTQDEYGNNKILQQYDIHPDKIYPKMKVLPIFKMKGFKKDFHKTTPYRFFKLLLADNQGETLLKTKQTALINCQIRDRANSIRAHWDSVKIAIRHHYVITDGGIWLDYLDLLHYFGKDLHSPKHVCPANLHAEHDKLSNKKREIMKLESGWRDYQHVCEQLRIEFDMSLKGKPVPLQLETNRLRAHWREIQARETLKKNRKKASENDKQYIKAKSRYFELEFTSKDLTISVLRSVKEFLEEAEELKHCVFSNEYFKKPNSLIFSAKVNGQRVETIELLLDRMEIVQARGMGNRTTEHNKRIVALLTKNLKKVAMAHNTKVKTLRKASPSQQVAA